MKILKEWKFFLMNQYSLKRIDWDDPSIVNQDSFDDFRVSTYDPDTSLRNQFAQMTLGIPSSGVTRASLDAAKEFRKGIK